jgi:hypothetical protein
VERRSRILIFLLLLLFGTFAPFLSASGQYYDYQLLIYRNLSKPKPGNTFIIYAQVYQGTEVIEDTEIRISSYPLEIINEIMSKESRGLFSYHISLPSTFNESWWLDFHLSAFIDGELATEEWYEIEIELPIEPELETVHSIEPSHVKPGETLEIYSYMPEMANGRINDGYIMVSIWPNTKWDVSPSPLAANLPVTYLGKGIFYTSWQVPRDIDLFDPNWETTELIVEIEVRGLEWSGAGLYVPLGDLLLAINGRIEDNNLELDISVVDFEFQPISEANLTLRFEQHLNLPEVTDPMIENRNAPLTDFQGRSFYSYRLNESCYWVDVTAQASKNDSIVVKTAWFSPGSSYPSGYFHVTPKNYNYFD